MRAGEITMFDATGAFTKQFTPFHEGYLVYPSRKTGGKLITADEYERLVGDWKRVAGKVGKWKMVGVVIAVSALWATVIELFLGARMDQQFPSRRNCARYVRKAFMGKHGSSQASEGSRADSSAASCN